MSQNKFDHLASEPTQSNPLPGMEAAAEPQPKPEPTEGATPSPKRKRRTAVEQALEIAQDKKDSWKDRLVGVLLIVLLTLLIAGAMKKLVETEPAPDPTGRVLVEQDQHLRSMLALKEELITVMERQVKLADERANRAANEAREEVWKSFEFHSYLTNTYTSTNSLTFPLMQSPTPWYFVDPNPLIIDGTNIIWSTNAWREYTNAGNHPDYIPQFEDAHISTNGLTGIERNPVMNWGPNWEAYSNANGSGYRFKTNGVVK